MADIDRVSISVLYSGTIVEGPPPPDDPIVLNVTPASGPTAGGTEVTITGTNLSPCGGIRFGGIREQSFVDDLSGAITAVTPAHVAGTVTVVVERLS